MGRNKFGKIWKGSRYLMVTLPNGKAKLLHECVIADKLKVPDSWNIHHLRSRNNNKFHNLLPLPKEVHEGVHKGDEEAIKLMEKFKEIKDNDLEFFQKIMDNYGQVEVKT